MPHQSPTKPVPAPPISRRDIGDALAQDAQEQEAKEQQDTMQYQRYKALARIIRRCLLSIVAGIEICFDIPPTERTKDI